MTLFANILIDQHQPQDPQDFIILEQALLAKNKLGARAILRQFSEEQDSQIIGNIIHPIIFHVTTFFLNRKDVKSAKQTLDHRLLKEEQTLGEVCMRQSAQCFKVHQHQLGISWMLMLEPAETAKG